MLGNPRNFCFDLTVNNKVNFQRKVLTGFVVKNENSHWFFNCYL